MAPRLNVFKAWVHVIPTFASVMFLIVYGVLNRGPISHGSLWGDDALLFRASSIPGGFASDLTDSFFQTGSAKSRPLLQPILSLLLQSFGNDQFWYLWISLVLVIAISVSIFFLVRSICGNNLVGIVGAIVVQTTRFNWYSKDNVFGIMEATAILLLVLSVQQIIHQLNEKNSSRRLLTGIIFLFASTLVHERYVLVSAAIPFAFVLISMLDKSVISKKNAVLSLNFFLIPAFHVIWKVSLLNVSPFTGGGESNFSSVKGPWILNHVIETATSVVGWSAGYKDAASSLNIEPFFLPLLASLVLLAICVGLYRTLNLVLRSEDSKAIQTRSTLVILFAFFSANVISASLVIERIEYRWLFGPLIFLILIISCLELSRRPDLHIVRISALIIAILIGDLIYQPMHKSDQVNAVRVQNALKGLENITHFDELGRDMPWKLVVVAENWESWKWWTLAYGNVFLNSDHAPVQVVFSTSDLALSSCLKDWKLASCTVLKLDGLNDQHKISRISMRNLYDFSTPKVDN